MHFYVLLIYRAYAIHGGMLETSLHTNIIDNSKGGILHLRKYATPLHNPIFQTPVETCCQLPLNMRVVVKPLETFLLASTELCYSGDFSLRYFMPGIVTIECFSSRSFL